MLRQCVASRRESLYTWAMPTSSLRKLPLALFGFTAAASGAGCGALLGLDAFSEGGGTGGGGGDGGGSATTTTGATGSTGGAASTSSASSSSGAGGTPVPCTPKATQDCYDGAAATEGKGLCKSGTQTCKDDGTGFGPCVGEVVPTPENCAANQDQDCNGTASQCTGIPLWSKRFGNATNDQDGYGVAIDDDGNAILSGAIRGTVDFGGGPLTPSSAFVAKLDSKGNYVFSKNFGLASTSYAVAADSAGNVVATGTFMGKVDFGGGFIQGGNSETIFLLKLDPSGAHLLSKGVAVGAWAFPLDVATDAQSNIFVCGYFTGTGDFGGGPIKSKAPNSSNDDFLVKFDANGNYVYAVHFGANQAQRVAVDGMGNAVIVGGFSGTVNFGGTVLTEAAGGIFAVKVGPTGQVVYAKSFGPGISTGNAPIMSNYAGGDVSVAADKMGNVILAGSYTGSATFGGSTLTSAGGKDLYVAKLDPMGNHLWSESFGSAGDQVAHGVGVDSFGNPVITGAFTGSLDFGVVGLSLFAGAKQQVFAAKLDAAGAPLWATASSGSSTQTDSNIAVNAIGDVALTGSFLGTLGFLATSLQPTGGRDIYVAKLAR